MWLMEITILFSQNRNEITFGVLYYNVYSYIKCLEEKMNRELKEENM